jgi:hypothetical protein
MWTCLTRGRWSELDSPAMLDLATSPPTPNYEPLPVADFHRFLTSVRETVIVIITIIIIIIITTTTTTTTSITHSVPTLTEVSHLRQSRD